jgi:hypothetical protein
VEVKKDELKYNMLIGDLWGYDNRVYLMLRFVLVWFRINSANSLTRCDHGLLLLLPESQWN